MTFIAIVSPVLESRPRNSQWPSPLLMHCSPKNHSGASIGGELSAEFSGTAAPVAGAAELAAGNKSKEKSSACGVSQVFSASSGRCDDDAKTWGEGPAGDPGIGDSLFKSSNDSISSANVGKRWQ